MKNFKKLKRVYKVQIVKILYDSNGEQIVIKLFFISVKYLAKETTYLQKLYLFLHEQSTSLMQFWVGLRICLGKQRQQSQTFIKSYLYQIKFFFLINCI